MLLRNIQNLLDCKVLCCEHLLNIEIEQVCGTDLMSNVLASTGANSLLITGLNNIQVVRTAEMSDIPAVVFIQGREPTPEIIELAREKNIVLMVSRFSMFAICGLLYLGGLRCGLDE